MLYAPRTRGSPMPIYIIEMTPVGVQLVVLAGNSTDDKCRRGSVVLSITDLGIKVQYRAIGNSVYTGYNILLPSKILIF